MKKITVFFFKWRKKRDLIRFYVIRIISLEISKDKTLENFFSFSLCNDNMELKKKTKLTLLLRKGIAVEKKKPKKSIRKPMFNLRAFEKIPRPAPATLVSDGLKKNFVFLGAVCWDGWRGTFNIKLAFFRRCAHTGGD